MISEVKSFEAYESYIREVANESRYSDPHFAYNPQNLYPIFPENTNNTPQKTSLPQEKARNQAQNSENGLTFLRKYSTILIYLESEISQNNGGKEKWR